MAEKLKWLTPSLRKELWRLYREGVSAIEISKALALSVPTVHTNITRGGGFEPRIGRRADALTESEREEIAIGVARGLSMRALARALCRAPSTISREVRRNSTAAGYRAHIAERAAWRRARRPKACKLARFKRLRNLVAQKLCKLWSPQQVARWLREHFPEDAAMSVSHETIYKTLFIQARGALKKELVAHLRSGREYRYPRRAKAAKRACVADGVSIRERPADVEDRAVPGHWEGDLLFGDIHSYIITLVERKTRYVMLGKIESKDTNVVVAALQKLIARLPTELRKSVTWDRGAELSAHAEFTVQTRVPVYFCDPRSPWQRGSNENTNGLLRQYFPRGTDLSQYSQAQLDKVARELNGRPRMTLDWRSPAEALNEVLR
jgi:IS30 family transposase